MVLPKISFAFTNSYYIQIFTRDKNQYFHIYCQIISTHFIFLCCVRRYVLKFIE